MLILLQWGKKLVEKLQEADNLAVNTNIIKFMAYDGRNVEFDFLATLDDFLIIIEMKSLLRPYDDDELYRRYKRVMEGVDQVNRRVKIVQKDWKKIKELASIKLPSRMTKSTLSRLFARIYMILQA